MNQNKYSCIIIDPPWKYNDSFYTKKILKYNVLDEKEIINFIKKYSSLFIDDCHIYFWTTSSFLESSIKICNELGFKIKQTLVWKKLTKNKKEFFGMGRDYRNSHELILFCKYIKNRNIKDKNIRTVFEDIALPRSQKPKQVERLFFEQSLSPGTRGLYLFAGAEKIPNIKNIDYIDSILEEVQ